MGTAPVHTIVGGRGNDFGDVGICVGNTGIDVGATRDEALGVSWILAVGKRVDVGAGIVCVGRSIVDGGGAVGMLGVLKCVKTYAESAEALSATPNASNPTPPHTIIFAFLKRRMVLRL